MQLPFLKKPETEKNYFLSLLIKPYKVCAILFEEVNDKLVILSTNETSVSSDIDQMSSEELLQAADRVISAVEPSLPQGVTVEKTIFSLPYDWIVESKIKEVYLEKLKGLCKALDLTPIGYLTAIEAIVHFIDKNEGAPVSAVFLEITKNRVFVYLVRAGKILESSSETVSQSVLATSEEILRKLNKLDVLPAKIILLDLENSSEMQQEFLSHKWSASIPFLHVPQVVVLEKGFENEAVVNGVAQQMELEILSDVSQASVSEEGMLSEANASDFGFMKEEDVAKISDVARSAGSTSTQRASSLRSDSGQGSQKSEVGLQNTEDTDAEGLESDSLERVTAKEKKDELDVNYFKENENIPVVDEEFDTPSSAKFSLAAVLTPIIVNLKKIKLPTTFPKVPLQISGLGGGSKNKLIGGIVAAAVLLTAFLFVYYNFILHANVVVFEDQKAVDKSTNITFSKDGSNGSIKMDIISEEVKGNEDKNATGTKETGDKAKGSVTIYNKTDNSKTFSSGTTVVGPNSLEFVLNDDVNIASTSSFSTSLTSASVKVTASQFGKQYNIPSGSNFTLKGYSTSDFIAKNSDATSGGSSKTTTVVSAKDLSDLLSLVTQKLQSDAVSKAQIEAGNGQVVLQTALSSTVKDKSYTKKVGDEVSSVGLSATLDFDFGKYNTSDLDNFVANLSKNDVPGSYVLQKGDSKVGVSDLKVSKDGNSAAATLKINAIYSPKIDPQSLAANLKGKTQKGADTKIRSITGVSDVNISFTHKFPLIPAIMPFNSKNITIEIKH